MSERTETKKHCPKCHRLSVVARMDPASGLFEMCIYKKACGYVMDLEEDEGW